MRTSDFLVTPFCSFVGNIRFNMRRQKVEPRSTAIWNKLHFLAYKQDLEYLDESFRETCSIINSFTVGSNLNPQSVLRVIKDLSWF